MTRATAADTCTAAAAAAANGMSATAAAMSATATSISRVGWDRQRGRKNNDGNPEFERQDNLLH
jgi:hypothetical protein